MAQHLYTTESFRPHKRLVCRHPCLRSLLLLLPVRNRRLVAEKPEVEAEAEEPMQPEAEG
jgi:hypothetical protein